MVRIYLCFEIETKLTGFPFLGVVTTAAFLERLAKTRLTRVIEGKIPGLSQQDCRDQQALLATILGPEGKDTTLAMDHGDFKPDNIIVDERYNIKGYVKG